MNIIIENISKDYSGKIVFENISAKLDSGDKIGLIGANGIGKTTLAKIIAGYEDASCGKINYIPRKEDIIYLSQNFLEDNINSICGKKVSKCAGENFIEYKKLLNSIGISEDKWEQSVDTLSGGEKTKVLLSMALTKTAELFILDEPTNHLDVDGIRFLENIINKMHKTMIIISHDRYFLDKTVSKIWEMNTDKLAEYAGNYTDYKLQKEIELKNNITEYEKQQDKIAQLKKVINDRKQWFLKAHNAAGINDFYRAKSKKQINVMHAKEKQLERIENNKVEKPKEESSPCFDVINKGIIDMKLPKYIIQVKNLSKSYGKKQVLKDVSFDVKRGDKIGIVGRNGCGKTTLLNILNGCDTDYSGSVSITPKIRMAYFSQQLENIDGEKDILENVLTDDTSKTEARILLSELLFTGDDVFKKVKVLSMGEKCRVVMAKIILSHANLLILDEPTNYMDIQSKEQIEKILKEYRGNVIVVSHDRYFINGIAGRIFEISGGKIKSYCGNYDAYVKAREEETKEDSVGENYKEIKDEIIKLECELSYVSGKLDEDLGGVERDEFDKQFMDISKKLRQCREKIKK